MKEKFGFHSIDSLLQKMTKLVNKSLLKEASDKPLEIQQKSGKIFLVLTSLTMPYSFTENAVKQFMANFSLSKKLR